MLCCAVYVIEVVSGIPRHLVHVFLSVVISPTNLHSVYVCILLCWYVCVHACVCICECLPVCLSRVLAYVCIWLAVSHYLSIS
jgi:hypothetical protein